MPINYAVTAIHKFKKFTGKNPGSVIDDAFGVYADEIDAVISTHSSGVLGARPAAGIDGRTYFATDVTVRALYYDNGSEWIQLYPRPLGAYTARAEVASLAAGKSYIGTNPSTTRPCRVNLDISLSSEVKYGAIAQIFVGSTHINDLFLPEHPPDPETGNKFSGRSAVGLDLAPGEKFEVRNNGGGGTKVDVALSTRLG